MLTPEQREQVIGLVAQELSLRSDVQSFTRTALQQYSIEVLGQLPTTMSLPREQAAFVVDRCIIDRWTREPSLLEQLLSYLILGGAGALVPIRSQVQARIDPNVASDPTRALWLPAEIPFFSRTQLRPLISKLLTVDAQPILRIVGPATGGEECGKSYTLRLIEHVAKQWPPPYAVVGASLPRGLAASYGADDLALELATPPGIDVVPMPQRDASSTYATKLCLWVLGALMRSGKSWLLVLDGFNQPDVKQEVRDFIEALAVRVTSGSEFRKRIRLVLLDYPVELATVQPAIVLREDVPGACSVTPDDVADCLDAHYADLTSDPAKPAPIQRPARAELAKVAAALLAAAPPGPAGRLAALQSQLHKLRTDDLARAGR